MEQVERVENDGMARMRGTMLQSLKRRMAVGVDRDDLAIEYRLIRTQATPGGGHRRIRDREILVVPRSDPDSLPVFQEERTVAIELDFVHPVRALRELAHDPGGHGLDEGGRRTGGTGA